MSESPEPVEVDLERIERFLNYEAFLLDEREYEDWTELLAEDISYRIPVRERGKAGVVDTPDDIYHVNDNYYRIQKRVQRLETDFAWAEDPPTRTRHFLSNVFVRDRRPPEVDVTSNLLLAVDRGNGTEFLTGRRDDTLREEGDELRIADREVLLDQTQLPVESLSFFV